MSILQSDDDIGTVEEEQALLQANLDYIQQMITDKQGEIVCMMESKGEGDTIEVSTIIRNSSVREAKYLLEHFLDMSINSVSFDGIIVIRNRYVTRMRYVVWYG